MFKNKRGIDIISHRFSGLEKEVLKTALDLKKDDCFYELGAGRGNFSLILALMHKKIFSLDLTFEKNFWKLKLVQKIFALKNWKIQKKDISQMNYKDFVDNISMVYGGRFWHYLKYSEAEKLLKILQKKMKVGGKLFFSISGIETDLAQGYIGKKIVIEKRFFKINPDLQVRFQIFTPICLYSKEEAEKLFSKYFHILKIEKTAFGNINIVAIKNK